MKAFVARQPIFDDRMNVFGYELLFRSSLANYFDHPDVNQASSKVIADSVLVFGLDTLLHGKRAFVNCSREVLVNDLVTVLPKSQTIVEILETIEPDAEVLAACGRLRDLGYSIALDDYVYTEKTRPLAEYADIIKVDFLTTDSAEQERVVKDLSQFGAQFLAEKVETQEEFAQGREMGYSLFQGYFFSKPVVLTGRDIPGFKLHFMQLIQELHKPQLSFRNLEGIVKHEVALSYKLLRYINSALIGLRQKVESLRQAMTLLGEVEFKKWATLVALASAAQDKPQELVSRAITRARFQELVAPYAGLGERSQEMFLMGLFSMLDAIVDQPLSEILKSIPMAQDVHDALTGKDNKLYQLHLCILCYEIGEWQELGVCATDLGIEENVLPQLFGEALSWSQQLLPAV